MDNIKLWAKARWTYKTLIDSNVYTMREKTTRQARDECTFDGFQVKIQFRTKLDFKTEMNY